MLSRCETIEVKARLLEHLDPEHEVKLEPTFTKHLADAIRAADPKERRQVIAKATEAYEVALDDALYAILGDNSAEEESSVA